MFAGRDALRENGASRTGARAALAALLVAFLGCGGAPETRREIDRFDSVAAPDGQPGRELGVVVFVDEPFQRTPEHERRIRERIEGASEVLAANFGLRLRIVDLLPWPSVGPVGRRDIERQLTALEEAPRPEGADVLIGFTAEGPPRRALMSDLSHSRYAGHAAVIRSLTSYFTADQTAALHDAEVLLVLHALSRQLGGVTDCPNTVLARRPAFLTAPRGPWRWSDVNAALIAAHLEMPLGREDQRLDPEVARRAREHLSQPGPLTRCAPHALTARRELLQAVIDHHAAILAQATAGGAADPAVRVAGAGPGEGAEGDEDQGASERAFAEALSALDGPKATRHAAFMRCATVAIQEPEDGASRCAARLAESLGRTEEAVGYYRAHLAHHPEDDDALFRLARLVGRSGDDGAARALLRRLVGLRPGHLDARINLGIAHARLGDVRAAEAEWLEVIRRDPAHLDARRLLDGLRSAPSPANR